MKMLDKSETLGWLRSKNLLDVGGKVSVQSFIKIVESSLPPDSGRKTALSRAIASLFRYDEEAILWIDEFGIWPSSEDWHLFTTFRGSLGEQSQLYEKPGHLFSREDLVSISSILAMTLYFIWGAVLYSPRQDLLVRVSHDEWIAIYCRDATIGSEIVQDVKNYLG